MLKFANKRGYGGVWPAPGPAARTGRAGKMATHPYLQKPREELLEMFVKSAMNPQNPDSVAIRTILEQRIAEDQLRIAEAQLSAAMENAKAGEHLATLTSELATATRRLVTATMTVAIVTALVAAV